MRVPVVMAVASAGHLFDRHDAAFKLLAADVLKLDGGVADVEVVFEHMVQLDQDAGAL